MCKHFRCMSNSKVDICWILYDCLASTSIILIYMFLLCIRTSLRARLVLFFLSRKFEKNWRRTKSLRQTKCCACVIDSFSCIHTHGNWSKIKRRIDGMKKKNKKKSKQKKVEKKRKSQSTWSAIICSSSL